MTNQYNSLGAIQRRLQTGQNDPRSSEGIYSRGQNVYNGGSYSSTGGARQTTDVKQPQTTSWGGGANGNQPYTYQFNPAYAARMRQLNQQRAQLGSSREMQERRLGEQYTFGMDALQRGLDRNLDQNKMNMADQGILRSGINVRQQGRIGEEHQRSVSDMAMEIARAREDMERGFAGQEQGIRNQMEMLEYERAQQEAERRRQEDYQRAQREAYENALESMQPVANSSGRYYAAGWHAVPNTMYPSSAGHNLGTLDGAVERALQR